MNSPKMAWNCAIGVTGELAELADEEAELAAERSIVPLSARRVFFCSPRLPGRADPPYLDPRTIPLLYLRLIYRLGIPIGYSLPRSSLSARVWPFLHHHRCLLRHLFLRHHGRHARGAQKPLHGWTHGCDCSRRRPYRRRRSRPLRWWRTGVRPCRNRSICGCLLLPKADPVQYPCGSRRLFFCGG